MPISYGLSKSRNQRYLIWEIKTCCHSRLLSRMVRPSFWIRLCRLYTIRLSMRLKHKKIGKLTHMKRFHSPIISSVQTMNCKSYINHMCKLLKLVSVISKFWHVLDSEHFWIKFISLTILLESLFMGKHSWCLVHSESLNHYKQPVILVVLQWSRCLQNVWFRILDVKVPKTNFRKEYPGCVISVQMSEDYHLLWR